MAVLFILVCGALWAQDPGVPSAGIPGAGIPRVEAASADEAAQRLLDDALASRSMGLPALAIEKLRALWNGMPDSPLAADALSWAVVISLETGDQYKARYYLEKVAEASPGSPASFRSALAVADDSYQRRSYTAALEYYALAIDNWSQSESTPRPDLDHALLRAAEVALYHARDQRAAQRYFRRLAPGNVPANDQPLYRTLRQRLVWSVLAPEDLGLTDANISAVRADGDDIWVGTWNDGVSRYTVSSGESASFPGPVFSRAIEITDTRVWVGTAEGLAWYGKVSEHWDTESVPGASQPPKIQSLRLIHGDLYAGTLGDGLLRLRGGQWERVGGEELPGKFINCIADGGGGSVLIGTMNAGLVILDTATGQMRGLSDLMPQFNALNVTAILADSQGRVWIGTYGDGLYLWKRAEGEIQHYTKASGELGDDWVLAVCETSRAVYFGTFGGGVSSLGTARGQWRHFGIPEGLASLDIPTIAWREPYVFFGTLGAGVCVYDEAGDGSEL